jgi:hypothetical protein
MITALVLVTAWPGRHVDAAPSHMSATPSQRLRTEALRTLVDLEARLANLECRGTLNRIHLKKPSGRCGDFRLKIRRADTVLIMAENLDEAGRPLAVPRLIFGRNATEFFMTKQTRDGKLVVSRGDQAPSYVQVMVETARQTWIDALAKGRFGGGRGLRELIGDPGFKMSRIDEVVQDNRTFVRIEFEHQYRQGDTPFTE